MYTNQLFRESTCAKPYCDFMFLFKREVYLAIIINKQIFFSKVIISASFHRFLGCPTWHSERHSELKGAGTVLYFGMATCSKLHQAQEKGVQTRAPESPPLVEKSCSTSLCTPTAQDTSQLTMPGWALEAAFWGNARGRKPCAFS